MDGCLEEREGRRVTRAPRHLLATLLALAAIGQSAFAQEAAARPAAANLRLQLAVVFSGLPLPPRVEASAVDEVRRIWAPYGVDLLVARPGEEEGAGDLGLSVVLADRPERPLAAGALGSILFVNDEPQPTVTMYQDAIDALLSTVTIAGSRSLEWPAAFHDAIEGRVLGRGLAHEIGHFLLRAHHHSDRGLMRAPHRTSDLVGENRQRFALSADDRSRLLSRLATSRHAPSETARPAGTLLH